MKGLKNVIAFRKYPRVVRVAKLAVPWHPSPLVRQLKIAMYKVERKYMRSLVRAQKKADEMVIGIEDKDEKKAVHDRVLEMNGRLERIRLLKKAEKLDAKIRRLTQNYKPVEHIVDENKKEAA